MEKSNICHTESCQNPRRYKKLCDSCYNRSPKRRAGKQRWLQSEQGKAYTAAYADTQRLINKRIRRESKMMVIEAYGGACACCGETNPVFLNVDHINNDGAEERAKIKKWGGHSFYIWLRKQGYPKDRYQLLCSNCDVGKYRNGGTCPHQDERWKDEYQLPEAA